MHILIAGGTGDIGRRLVQHLIRHGHTVTVASRRPYRPASLPAKIGFVQWDAASAAGWGHVVEEVEAVVNLAGASIAGARWSEARKKLIQDSRTQAGRALVEAMTAAQRKPKVLVQASAVGYYGPRAGDEEITEAGDPGNDFLASVCRAWEASTEPVEAMGVRRVVIRTGVVLDVKGGALPKMLLPFHFFAGGPVGSGRQWMPWIHYRDEVDAIRFLVEHESAGGPFNLTAPHPVQNKDFVKAVGRALRRPALAPAPAAVLKLLFGEMSSVLLSGQRAVPKRLLELGFAFKFPTVQEALADLFER